MKQVAYIDKNGFITQCYETFVDVEVLPTAPPEQTAIFFKSDIPYADLCLNHYYKNNEFKQLPTKPSEYHTWDLQSEQWQHSEELYNAFILRKETEVKTQRNRLLAQSDYTELPSFLQRNGEAVVTAWQTYRQALRDITLQTNYPLDVIWPTQP